MAEATNETEITDNSDSLGTTHKTGSGSNGSLGEDLQSSAQRVASLGPDAKLKANLAQKSRNLSAKDKAKIAEMVRGLSKFKHAEEDFPIEPKGFKPKVEKEKKHKEKKGKSKELFKDTNEDEWEDIDSEDELPQPQRKTVADNIFISLAGKSSATVQPKAEKSPQHKAHKSPKTEISKAEKKKNMSPKVGSYTKLLQSFGGRAPGTETGSSPGMVSVYRAEAEAENQSDPWSVKELQSRKRAEAQQQLLELFTAQDSGRGAVQGGRESPSSGGSGVKLSHKEQAKLRSEIHKLDREGKQSLRPDSPKTQERNDQPAPVIGGAFLRPFCDPAQAEVAGGQPQDSLVTNTKRRRERKKKKQEEQMKQLSQKVFVEPATAQRVVSPTPNMPPEMSSPTMAEVKIRVPKSDHRFIVGMQRKNLIEIHNLTGVTIDVPKINDDSEEVILRGEKFQIGPAITLMFTKCEVSRAEIEQKQKAKEIVQSQMAYVQGPPQQVTGQGQKQRPGSGQGQNQGRREVQGQKMLDFGQQRPASGPGKGGNKGQGQKGQRSEMLPQFQSQEQLQEMIFYGTGSQGNRSQGQRSSLQNQRPKSGQGQRQENQKGKPQGQGSKKEARSQGQNKKQDQQNKQRKAVSFTDQSTMQPLIYGSKEYQALFATVQQWYCGLGETTPHKNISTAVGATTHEYITTNSAKQHRSRKNKKKQNKQLKPNKLTLHAIASQPLVCDSVWLQQGSYEAAEACYQKFLAGSSVLKPSKSKRTKSKQLREIKQKVLIEEPLMYDSVWLEQGRFATAEAHYQRVLAGTAGQKNFGCIVGGKNKTKKVFEPYWPIEAISGGLKRGLLIQGPVRINPKNYEEAYVPHPDGKSDILICSFIERNRALNGDIVAVLLKEEGDWKVHKEELQDLESKHGPLPSEAEELLEGNNSDSADVKIESEEIIVIENCDNLTENADSVQDAENKDSTASKDGGLGAAGKLDTPESGSQTPKQEKGKEDKSSSQSKGSKSPNKALQRYHNLSDVLSEGSPVAKRMFGSCGEETEMFEQARKLLVRTGKVVGIIEKKHSRACTGTVRPLQDKNPNKALFAPSDFRLPRLLIPMEDSLKGLHERPEDFAKTLYVARMTDWKEDSKMAFGKLARSLGEAGEIEPETEGMLIENGVDFDEFPQQALDCLPSDLPWSIPESEFEYRRDFRESCIFTIDPLTARDLDDALSCEDLGNGMYKVGVHIADVSWFIAEGSFLDRVAGLRATSVYLVHKVIPMLPRLLCEQLCSLNPDEDRLTFSVEWTISESGEIQDEWFGRSVIRSCVKLSYEHAQGFIEQPDREWTQEEIPPVSEGFTVQDIQTRVLNLHKIARNLRKARFDGGCLRLDQIKLQYSLDAESGLPNGYSVYQQKESNSLVEEFMLLANMAVAHRINDFYPDKALLRRHPPPQEKMLENLKDQCEALGLHLDTSGAGQLQRSLWRYYDNDEYSLARMQVLVSLCSKPMQNAKYFCTGCIDDESLYHHYALNVPLYTHFTSPIRRYPDVIVHRLLGATLDYCEEPQKSPQDLQKMAEHCNDKKTAAKRCSDLSSELFFAVFVKVAGPLEEKAMVMAVFDKAFDIFILRLGVTKRVYCDKLDIKDKIYSKEKKVPSLILVWNMEEDVNTTEDSSELRQVITIFTVVDCVLKEGDLPLQWAAIIKRPTKPDLVNFQHLTIHDQDDMTEEEILDTEEITDLETDNTKEKPNIETDNNVEIPDSEIDNKQQITDTETNKTETEIDTEIDNQAEEQEEQLDKDAGLHQEMVDNSEIVETVTEAGAITDATMKDIENDTLDELLAKSKVNEKDECLKKKV